MRALVGIDDSEESFHALNWILHKFFWKSDYPAAMNGSELVGDLVTIVHVMEPWPHNSVLGGPAAESVSRTQEQDAARILARASEMCRDKMVKAKTLIVEGDPKNVICQMTEEMAVDIVVVGSRGLGQIKRALLGSVSDYCAHHARCPVLIVKPPN
nr:universal stress protein YxiE-like isoform X1 [Ipomoea batatas]